MIPERETPLEKRWLEVVTFPLFEEDAYKFSENLPPDAETTRSQFKEIES